MAFQRRKVAAALAYLAGVGTAATLLTAAPAYAQDMRVTVTGSNIPRIADETALPVQVITREEIDRTGATSAQDLLQYITAATSSGNFNSNNVIGATTFGLQTASLRGLGGARTLVLLNGRRLGGFAGDQLNGQSVNLTAIPFSAIDRVEVLKDGASAIYGTDAIAGVINFILRKDYKGAEVNIQYGQPTRSPTSDGTVTDITATAGFGDLAKDRWNVLLTGNWHKEEALYQKDRNFSNSSDHRVDSACSASRATPSRPTSRRRRASRRSARSTRPSAERLPGLQRFAARSGVVLRPEQPVCYLRPGRRRAVDAGDRDDLGLRQGHVPAEPRLAGVRQRRVLQVREQERDPAGPAVGHLQRPDPPAAVEPVLPDRVPAAVRAGPRRQPDQHPLPRGAERQPRR